MGKNKKASFGMSKKDADKLFDSIFRKDQITAKDNGDNLVVKEEFDGSFSNPFSDREIPYVLPGITNLTPDASSSVESKPSQENHTNGANVNTPTITDKYDFPGDDERMLNRLLFLSDYLNGKYKPHSDVSEQEFEDMKWETINETYCLVTVDLPRKNAELIRKYFRRLDTTYAKQDGTYYSKVTKGALAKEVIDDLIESYPWNEADKIKTTVVMDGIYKRSNNMVKSNPCEIKSPDEIFNSDEHTIKDAISNLSKSVEKLNEILLGK